MKNIIFTLLAFISLLSVQAQSAGKATALLNEVSSKVEAYENISIEFKYLLENAAEKIKQETRGDVVIKGDKYLLNIMGTTRLFDGKMLYTIIPEDEEINISAYNPNDDDNITPSKMFTFYRDGYKSVWGDIADYKGRKIQYIKLFPLASNSEIQEINLGIDSQTKHIYNLIQTQKDGTKITITVQSFKTDQPLPQSLFQFKESRYKNFYINRLD